MWRRVVLGVVAAGAVAAPPASGVTVAAPPVATPTTVLPPMPGVAPPWRLPDRLPVAPRGYRTLAAHDAAIDALAAAHPGLVRALSLPRASVEGRPIRAVELATDVARTDDGRPALVVLGTLHAREWASGEVAQLFARDLADGWATDARIRALLDRVRVIVVPVVNPDGFVRSREDPRRRWWRTNAEGVDLNRNAGALWGGPGTSDRPGSGVFRGTAPWSAPEAAAVHELLRRRPVTAVVDLHTVAGVVLHPPGVDGAPVTPDERVAARLTRAMGEAAGYRAGRVDDVLYEVSGTIGDWAFGAQGALAATIELGGRGFFGSYDTNVVAPYLGHVVADSGSRDRRSRAFGRPAPGPGDDGIRGAWPDGGDDGIRGPSADGGGDDGIRGPSADGGGDDGIRGPSADGGDDSAPSGGAAGADEDASRSPAARRGDRATPRGGVREALVLAAEAAADPARHGVLTGVAPPGALLTASRSFATPTSTGTTLPDGLATSLRVGDAGTFTWHLGPSTRPATALAGGREAWTVTCTLGSGEAGSTRVVLARGGRVTVAPCVTAS